MGVVAVVGSNWFDGLCLYVCVALCVCGDEFGQVDQCIMGLCVCVEPVVEFKGEREGKK